jgi:predicted GNAT family acetyltransferase
MVSQLALKDTLQTMPLPDRQMFTGALKTFQLASKDNAEVLAFLAQRPLHNVIMSGLVRDNGLVSPLNRGTFYACRDVENRLAGVALMGHATYVEAYAAAALDEFAQLAQENSHATHMILGESAQISRLWQGYQKAGKSVRRVCRESMLEMRWPLAVREAVRGLRLATLDDLIYVMPVQATMAEEESGVNPLETDPLGFRLRCARRIEQNRVWVWVEDGQLLFKADILADTPEVSYLEGVYVASEARGKGYGIRCFAQLSRQLLARTQSLCLLVNEQNQTALQFYRRAGFKLRGQLDTIFLNRTEARDCSS